MTQIDGCIVNLLFTKLGTNCAIDHGPLSKIATICNCWTNIDKGWTNFGFKNCCTWQPCV